MSAGVVDDEVALGESGGAGEAPGWAGWPGGPSGAGFACRAGFAGWAWWPGGAGSDVDCLGAGFSGRGLAERRRGEEAGAEREQSEPLAIRIASFKLPSLLSRP